MSFESRRGSSLRSPTDRIANGSRTQWRLVSASLRLAVLGISFPHPPSCMTLLGEDSRFSCGWFFGSLVRKISCSFQPLAYNALRPSNEGYLRRNDLGDPTIFRPEENGWSFRTE